MHLTAAIESWHKGITETQTEGTCKMLTQCTNPAAPFYKLDMIAISIMEAYGIDMPCDMLLMTGTTLFVLALGIPVLGLALACQGRV